MLWVAPRSDVEPPESLVQKPKFAGDSMPF
jgi:hypothetical protein